MKSNKNTKRKLFVAVTAGMVALSLMIGPVSSFANSTRGKFIGEAKAKQIALNNAGLKEKDVSFVKTGLKFDDGRSIYDIEFYSGNTEYDFEIDTKTGKILDFDYDMNDDKDDDRDNDRDDDNDDDNDRDDD